MWCRFFILTFTFLGPYDETCTDDQNNNDDDDDGSS